MSVSLKYLRKLLINSDLPPPIEVGAGYCGTVMWTVHAHMAAKILIVFVIRNNIYNKIKLRGNKGSVENQWGKHSIPFP